MSNHRKPFNRCGVNKAKFKRNVLNKETGENSATIEIGRKNNANV